MSLEGPRVGRLYVCPTPIGNLLDVTMRVLETLTKVEVLACEDTRHSRLLLDRYGIPAPELVSFHEHNERERTAELVARIGAGEGVALLSDAGTPVVSDPGYRLVRACLEAGLAVEVLPGPSAVLTALVASGLPVESWRFVGFLPRRRSELVQLLAGVDETLVAFESPRRVTATLDLLVAQDPLRPVALCRELTKLHEEVRRGTAAELLEHYREHRPKGEIVLVIGSAERRESDLATVLAALRALVDSGARARMAAQVLAGLTGLGANKLYEALLEEEHGRRAEE